MLFWMMIASWTFAESLNCNPFKAVVKRQSDHKPIYTEFYEPKCENGRWLKTMVEYKSPEQKLIASQEISPSTRPYLPAVKFKDFRDGYEYRIEDVGEKYSVQVIEVEKTGAQPKEKKVFVGPDVFIYQGAPVLIQDRIALLKNQKQISARYLFASHRMIFGVFIKPKTQGKELALDIELKSALARKFAPPMHFVVDADTHRIKSFKGNATLLDERDRPIAAEVEYIY